MEYEAGPELDRLIAEKVMGETLDWGHTQILSAIDNYPEGRTCNDGRGLWCACQCGLNGPANEIDWAAGCTAPYVKPYSTDIAAAWAVVEYLRAKGYAWQFAVRLRPSATAYDAAIFWESYEQPFHVSRDAATMPLAICRAALQAVDAP